MGDGVGEAGGPRVREGGTPRSRSAWGMQCHHGGQEGVTMGLVVHEGGKRQSQNE